MNDFNFDPERSIADIIADKLIDEYRERAVIAYNTARPRVQPKAPEPPRVMHGPDTGCILADTGPQACHRCPDCKEHYV